MHRAFEFLFEDGTVNFVKLPFGNFVVDANHDAIRVKKISDGCAFTQKFRIGGDAETYSAAASVNPEDALQLLSCLRGDGALLDDELVGLGLDGNHLRDVIYRAEIRVASRKRRRSHANEDGVAFRSSARVDGKGQTAFLAISFHHAVEAGLEDGQFAGFECVDFGFVVISAKNVMTEFCQACAGDKADVTCAYDGYSHGLLSLCEPL
jgi:hypothetical protein